MTRSIDEALIEEHERYMKEVSESGMPMWLMDYYARVKDQRREEENLKNQHNNLHHEIDKKNSKPDDTGDDPHLFI